MHDVAPHFFDRAKWESGYVTFPDRFNLLREWIESGGHIHMNDGWYSFSGQLGKGGWGRSLFADVLPVECLQTDDLLESTESFQIRVNSPEHPAITGIDFQLLPPLLGFNETRPREEFGIIVDVNYAGQWFPLLASRRLGDGRVSVWTSGASPHWGINLAKWSQYDQFWQQIITADY